MNARLDGAGRALPPEVLSLGHLFADAGHELALVGGPVRDLLLDRPPSDLDFTTSALPDETERLLRGWGHAVWTVGKRFGTIGARHGGLSVEITTYRADTYDPSSRKPEVRFGDNLEGDLSRRDFTVNAMALSLPQLVLVDPFDGRRDLQDGLLRTPVTAEQSFDDDPLRIMRAARFTAQLGFDVAEDVMDAMGTMAERLSIVSAERVQAELVKLMCARWPRRGLELMVYTGVADHVLPELAALQLETDEHHRHKDVYEHTLTVLDKAMALETGPDGPVPAPDLVLRLAAILHDIGKPATRRFEKDGTVSFHHHDVVGAKLAAKRLKALKFDSQTVKDVSKLVELHLRFYGYGDAGWTDSAVRRYVRDAGPLLARLNRLTRSDVTTRNKKKADRLAFAMDDLERRIAELAAQEEIDKIRPDLNGDDIMGLLGIGPGPVVGRAYKHMLALRMDEGPMDRDAAVAALREWWAAQPESQA
ncbi:MAG: CCA tRNA nucleotidyltransferase [Bifidobacteriaceae bacterium]|nr:CCA tRNA nucleotidyltransferase [Bifidobacteriaceae bacterium]